MKEIIREKREKWTRIKCK